MTLFSQDEVQLVCLYHVVMSLLCFHSLQSPNVNAFVEVLTLDVDCPIVMNRHDAIWSLCSNLNSLPRLSLTVVTILTLSPTLYS